MECRIKASSRLATWLALVASGFPLYPPLRQLLRLLLAASTWQAERRAHLKAINHLGFFGRQARLPCAISLTCTTNRACCIAPHRTARCILISSLIRTYAASPSSPSPFSSLLLLLSGSDWRLSTGVCGEHFECVGRCGSRRNLHVSRATLGRISCKYTHTHTHIETPTRSNTPA